MINAILETIERQLKTEQRPVIVAIDGMSGSGKTTLAHTLQQHFPQSNVFHMDDYFLQPHQRTTERLSEVGGNVNYERFREEVLLHVNDADGLVCRAYDCRTQTLGSDIHVPWQPLVIIEGAYSQHPYFGTMYDIRIFCKITKEEQKERIIKRSGKEKWERFENEWIPKEQAYLEKYQVKEHCDFVL